jgi:serine/threonine protein kinase
MENSGFKSIRRTSLIEEVKYSVNSTKGCEKNAQEVHSEIRSPLDDWLLGINDYEVKDFLGKGAFGNVYRVVHSSETETFMSSYR